VNGNRILSDEEVETRLRAEVQEASSRLEAAKAEFRRIASQTSDQPWSAQSLAAAASSQNLATEALAVALRRFSRFLAEGEHPVDINRPPDPPRIVRGPIEMPLREALKELRDSEASARRSSGN
jgi:hypothetical protein